MNPRQIVSTSILNHGPSMLETWGRVEVYIIVAIVTLAFNHLIWFEYFTVL
ncbi:hypothetical protein SPLC1_S500680 [Arthrospira platensis C1]|nr:hypothetical protein SPLC1_S500680 [Arthrospira platensis C1]